ncbi:ABC transporter substrate-binding protein [Azospirillum sp. TSH100]|uniref:Bug family tripartite tricarboxylate transporter substrate binding protein n=1 Tax=Azospirillum sp. TSH100 TaxID=652764 RepID=UPI000D622DEE|nr:tripartite tricarboxylate transporter substrate binding protein [Azospirillum sp. TSH100]PWC87497.1 ABC transporter substrate-binding protein [Azospirillum sp. TSH100]QCG89704.1 tripartite tricarboxylate transporter substrate binding protein [Azospirillum sp. TSH100]
MTLKLTRRQVIAAGAALPLVPTAAQAALTEKPVRWIVGYPPGGSTDTLARMLSTGLSKSIGQTVIVDNRPGAGSAIAAGVLAAAAPDGLTVMGADNGTLINNPVLYKDLKYDPDRDFRPVGLYAGINLVLAVGVNSSFKTGAEFVAAAKVAKEPITYASPGLGSPLHLAMERFVRDADIRLTHIPYRGMAPALTDALASVVQSIIIDYTTASEAIKGGLLRPLAVFSKTRLAALPDVPTMSEQGVPGFSAGAWQGVIVPRKTPDAVVASLSHGLTAALSDPGIRLRYDQLGLELPQSDPETFARRWQQDKEYWPQLIRSLGIKLD